MEWLANKVAFLEKAHGFSSCGCRPPFRLAQAKINKFYNIGVRLAGILNGSYIFAWGCQEN